MIKQFRIPFGLKPGSSILTFRARHVPNAPEGCLEARWRDWPLTFFCQTFPKNLQNLSKNVKIFVENWSGRGPYGFLWIRMDPYGSVWSLRTPWGLPGASWGPGGSKKGGKGVLPPGGAHSQKALYPPLGPPGPQKAPGSPQGVPRDHTIRTHTGPYGSIQTPPRSILKKYFFMF